MTAVLFFIAAGFNILSGFIWNLVKAFIDTENTPKHVLSMMFSIPFIIMYLYAGFNPTSTFAFVLGIVFASLCGLGSLLGFIALTAGSATGTLKNDFVSVLLHFLYNTPMCVLFIITLTNNF